MLTRVLVVDDDCTFLRSLDHALSKNTADISVAQSGLEALQKLEEKAFDLIFCEQKILTHGNIDLLQTAKTFYPHCLFVVTSPYANIEAAVNAMRLGAFHYLTKPCSPPVLEIMLKKALESIRWIKNNHSVKEESDTHLVVESTAMKKILSHIEKIAKSQASVFITGESGTGKEVIAKTIHRLSLRSRAPFIKVNCAAIPDTLVESEFFGHEKGAFTGAILKKNGRFELADQGTLLLDEVTEIPLILQPKLLRAIQEQEFERVGGTKPIKVNIRFLATSNRNMQEAIETKMFREDLYYRLNVMPIHIPSLRERPEDILPLASYFLEKTCRENHKPLKRFTPKAIQKLVQYPWPGNVRELSNTIERTVILDFDTDIDAEHVYLDSSTEQTSAATDNIPTNITLRALEKRCILATLAEQHYNRTKTASILGISIRTLRNKLHEYELTDPEKALPLSD